MKIPVSELVKIIEELPEAHNYWYDEFVVPLMFSKTSPSPMLPKLDKPLELKFIKCLNPHLGKVEWVLTLPS